jgi:endonuclease G
MYIIQNTDPKTVKSEARPSSFSPDPSLAPAFQVRTEEYNSCGYDRGHMAPNWAISTSYGRKAQLETFYTTNICPQKPECNRHIWEQLEKIEATDYARRYNSVLTYTGPIFTTPLQFIGKQKKIAVPTAFYKIIVKNEEKPEALAFIIPQNPEGDGRKGLEKYLVSIEEIEKKTNLQFLKRLSEKTQNQLKTQKATKMW